MVLCLAASVGALHGCRQSAALPPASLSRSARTLGPTTATLSPRTHQPAIPNTTTWIDNPWKPEVPPRDWRSIVIHHTATDSGSVESIHNAHLNRKDKSGNSWLGIGYHFVIGNGNGMGDGEIEPTFRWKEQMHGAHAGDDEHNQHGVGIALVGNFEEGPPTAAQLAAVKRLVSVLKQEYGIESDHVLGHRDIKSTACPGKYFPLAEVAGLTNGLTLSAVTESGKP